MSSGRVQQGFFAGILKLSTTPSDFSTLDSNSPNKTILNEIENINIINQSYQKAVVIHNILLNNNDLSNSEKFDFCNIGRYFMKQYLKEVIKKLE
jgi:hypothetical protein